ncbi:MAG TPA: tRNA dihydrouridine synthase DusB [Chitinivibrionales bacterium]
MDFQGEKIFLAPLAGISDTVFRTLCKQHGADVVVSEMISAEGLFHGGENTRELLAFDEAQRPIGIQIFGAQPARIAYAAACIEEHYRPDFIDLNSGCPVPKVVRKNGGSALLRDRKLFTDIVSALVRAVSTPVTVKLRSGWTLEEEFVDTAFARIAQDCGAAAIILHPRTKSMGFSGHSLWERITAVKRAVSIPVIGNGDIRCGQDAAAMFNQTGCDSIMIGRAALGNPWIFSQIKQELRGEQVAAVSAQQRFATIMEHLRLFTIEHGESRALGEMKKHIAWYIKGHARSATLRNDIFRAQTLDELKDTTALAFKGND